MTTREQRDELEVLIAQTKMSNGHLPVGIEVRWVHNLADAILSRWSLSPVVVDESPKLDPEPWALLVNTDVRYSSNLLIASAQRVVFVPRPGYSQDLADYSNLELDPKPMVSLGDWDRHGLGPECQGYECQFAPRPEYSQRIEDYR